MIKPTTYTIEVIDLLRLLEYLEQFRPGIRDRMLDKLEVGNRQHYPVPTRFWADGYEDEFRKSHGDDYIDDLLLIEKEFPELNQKITALVDW